MQKENKIKLAFLGSGDFGLPALKALLASDSIEISYIVTGVDKPKDRGLKFIESPIKKFAQQNNIGLIQISSLDELKLENSVDVFLVIAFSKILTEKYLNFPTFGCINLHGSLLPKYRGAACIQAPILNGDKYSGISLIKMNTGLDTGDIIYSKELRLDKHETYASLYQKLSYLGAEAIVEQIKKYVAGNIILKKQNNSLASYVGKLTKKDGQIDWHFEADYLERFIRAMYPWPGAWTILNNKKIKILRASIFSDNAFGEIGQMIELDKKLLIKTKTNFLKIDKMQMEGKRETTGHEFLNGNKNIVGHILGK